MKGILLKYGQLVISDKRDEDGQVKGFQRHRFSLRFHRPLRSTSLGCQWCQSSGTGCIQGFELPPRQIYLEPAEKKRSQMKIIPGTTKIGAANSSTMPAIVLNSVKMLT